MDFLPPQDDVIDVIEMASKIEDHVWEVLKDNDANLGMSSLISVTVNYMLAQCKTLDEIVYYRNTFMDILDDAILRTYIKKKSNPS